MHLPVWAGFFIDSLNAKKHISSIHRVYPTQPYELTNYP